MTTQTPLPYVATESSLTVFFVTGPITLNADDRTYKAAIEAIRNEKWNQLESLMDRATGVRNYLATGALAGSSDIVFDGAAVLYHDRPIRDGLTERLLRMAELNFPIAPLVRFLERLYRNPSARAIDETLNFMDSNSLPLTPDGCFLAYKRVRDDYLDVYSGTLDNSVGNTVRMLRNEVNDDSTQTCSFGLHVASLEYLNHYTGARLVAVKVDPGHVVSIPTEYNNSKVRVCEYTVIAELDITKHLREEAWDTPVCEDYEPDEDNDNDEEEAWEDDLNEMDDDTL